MKDVRRNLGESTDSAAFLSRLESAGQAATQSPTAQHFMEFYKELNGMGKWMGRSQKDRLINQVKNGIKDTFRAEGPQGRALAERFEEANTGIRRAYQAEEAHDLIQATMTQDGINYRKFNQLFDKQENVHLFEEVLGQRLSDNLHRVARTGRDITNFDKSYRVASILSEGPVSAIGKLGMYAYSGNWAAVAAMKGGQVMAKKLAELSLTDPRFQNLLIKGLHSIQLGSPQLFRVTNDAMEKYLKENVMNRQSKDKK